MNEQCKIIISPSYGNFSPNRAFAKIIKQAGIETWDSIEGRTHHSLIQFVESQEVLNPFGNAFIGAEKDQFLKVVTVDTSKAWTILTKNGAEELFYLTFEIVVPELNYYQFKS